MTSGAAFSPCRTYRYHLWRSWWGERLDRPCVAEQRCLFVMLNPSTATETENDPTIRRCIGFAKSWEFDGVEICNIFALRSTDPTALKTHPEPVGGLANDAAILAAAEDCRGRIVAAWGNHGRLRDRGLQVYEMLRGAGFEPLSFRVTNEGQPEHPLYQPKAREPAPFELRRSRS